MTLEAEELVFEIVDFFSSLLTEDDNEFMIIICLISFIALFLCCCCSGGKSRESSTRQPKQANAFMAIADQYKTMDEVTEGLRKSGLEGSNLVLAIDYTKSNMYNGQKSFGGKSLHYIDPDTSVLNPYQAAISTICSALKDFDDDDLIPTFGFGDAFTTDRSVFPFYSNRPCEGLEDVLTRYNEITSGIKLSGPTNFAPAIEKAIELAKNNGYHILVIICDGAVTNERQTRNAIVKASKYPLSIICIGVGDGPWDLMEEFDDELPQRAFDNFQFVNYTEIARKAENIEVEFAIAALQELPDQYKAIRKLNLL